jgi:hypothetical protein
VQLIEAVYLLGATDRLPKFQLNKTSDQGVPEKKADQEGGESGAEGSEGDVLEDIQSLGAGNAMQGGHKLGEVV